MLIMSQGGSTVGGERIGDVGEGVSEREETVDTAPNFGMQWNKHHLTSDSATHYYTKPVNQIFHHLCT